MSLLEPLELDALGELLNIGVNKAAGSLRKMVEQRIVVTVPSIQVMPVGGAEKLAWQADKLPLVAISQAFHGPFSGKAFLIFPAQSGTTLVRIVAGDAMSGEALAGFEDEALTEVGNIVLNACLGTAANMLEQTIRLAEPVVIRGSGTDLADGLGAAGDEMVLVLHVSFGIEQRDVTGYVALVIDPPSLLALQATIAAFIARVG